MPELRVIAVNNEGARLVLASPDGLEYTLPIDDRLRAAVRGDRARLGQIEIELESRLRPREIQARIRAGTSAEEVAAVANIPVERVRRFAGPVLAERTFVAERAQTARVKRSGDDHGPPLGQLINERLHQHKFDPDSLRWDAWRRNHDGRWQISLSYCVAEQEYQAQWTYDAARRFVTADNDEGRWLIGEEPVEPRTPAPFVPRFAELREDEPDKGRSMKHIGPVGPVAVEVDNSNPQSPNRRESAPEKQRPGRQYETAMLPRVVEPHRERLTGVTDRQAESDGVRPGRRATVPSWDEIVFGRRRPNRD